MSNTPSQLEEILEEFRDIDDPEEYFELLIERGNALEELPPEQRRPDNRVPGCVSGVHITGRLEDGRVYFSASADSHLVRGLVAIVVEGLSGLRPEQILAVDPKVLQQAGLTRSLTPSRANASHNILQMIKEITRKLTASRD